MLASTFVTIDIAVSLIEEYTSLTQIVGQEVFSISFFVYMTLFVCLAFEGAMKRKILHSGVMLILTLVSDIVVMILLTAFGVSTIQMSNGFFNAVAMALSKIVMLVIIKIVLAKKYYIMSC